MDHLKCRAKRVDNEEWVYGYYANCRYKDKLETGHFIIKYPDEYHEIYTRTVSRYTGFKDNKGNKIYEGDKLLLTVEYEEFNGDLEVECVVGVVEWYEGGWIIDSEGFDEDDSLYDWVLGVVEVVGNIYK